MKKWCEFTTGELIYSLRLLLSTSRVYCIICISWSNACAEGKFYLDGIFRSATNQMFMDSVNTRKVALLALEFAVASQSSTRPGLLTKMKKFDLQFVTCIHRPLSKVDSIFINSFLATENLQHWLDNAGSAFRGAASIWSPLQVST